LDALIAGFIAEPNPRPLTAAQSLELYERIPRRAQRRLLAATIVTLLRLYLTDPAVDPETVDGVAIRHNLANVLYQ
jgi:hypothetical protein